MAREHAQIKLAMWADDDFRSLSVAAQHLYLVLLTSPSLSYCGVADWRPKRLAALAGNWSADDVYEAAEELEENRYAYFNDETDEVLIRSFVRNDGVMDRKNMATAMAKAHSAIACSRLRGIVVCELKRLHEDKPGLDGWESEKAVELLSKASFEPPAMQSVMPSVMPLPTESGNESVDLPPTPAPSPAPNSMLQVAPQPAVADTDSSTPKKPAKRLPDDWTPTEKHHEYAEEHGVQLDSEVFKFRNHAHANDRRQASWNAAFSQWLAKAREYSAARPGFGGPLRDLNRDPRTGRAVDW